MPVIDQRLVETVRIDRTAPRRVQATSERLTADEAKRLILRWLTPPLHALEDDGGPAAA